MMEWLNLLALKSGIARARTRAPPATGMAPAGASARARRIPDVVWDPRNDDGRRVLCTVPSRVPEDMEPRPTVETRGDSLAARSRHQHRLLTIAAALYALNVARGEVPRSYDGYPVLEVRGRAADGLRCSVGRHAV